MIARELFLEHWQRICRRFDKAFDRSNLRDAEDYMDFLGPRMSDEEFDEAARAVWATAKWFPRPADFLAVQAANEWRTVLELAQAFEAETWAQLTTAAKMATEALGGTAAIRKARDVGRTRERWIDAYEREVQAESAVKRLASPNDEIGQITDGAA